MSRIEKVGRETHDRLLHEMTESLMEALGPFAQRNGLAGMSTMTLALQSVALGLQEMGGISAKQYMICLIDGMYCLDAKEGQRLDERGRRAMEKMVQHYDLHASTSKRPMQ